jgi:hypothetical protein
MEIKWEAERRRESVVLRWLNYFLGNGVNDYWNRKWGQAFYCHRWSWYVVTATGVVKGIEDAIF